LTVFDFVSQAKKHQSEFDNNYNNCLTELQALVATFGKSKSPTSKSGTPRIIT
jgi:hypothetical protein